MSARSLESVRQYGVALCIVLGFSILPASIGTSVVRDRVTGAKRLQHISGLGYRTYWLTHFLYDMVGSGDCGRPTGDAFPVCVVCPGEAAGRTFSVQRDHFTVTGKRVSG